MGAVMLQDWKQKLSEFDWQNHSKYGHFRITIKFKWYINGNTNDNNLSGEIPHYMVIFVSLLNLGDT